MRVKLSGIVILIAVLVSCSYSLVVDADPDAARIRVNGVIAASGEKLSLREKTVSIEAELEGYEPFKTEFENKLFKTNSITIKLEKLRFLTVIQTDEGSSAVLLNGSEIGKTPCEVLLEYGVHTLVLRREGYVDERCRVDVFAEATHVFHHHPEGTPFKALGIFPCGRQPKQVIFSPDDDFILIPLLDDKGFDVFSMKELRVVQRIEPPDPSGQTGYPEGLFLKELGVFWVTQMTTGSIYEYSWPDLVYKRTMPTGGVWSKFIAWNKEQSLAAVSNWLSNTVSIIDPESGTILKKLATAAVPRGLVFTRDGTRLVVTAFEGGAIELYDTLTWKKLDSIRVNGSAMRHAVLSPDDSMLYVSDMGNGAVYAVDMETFSIVDNYKVDDNANTIDISPDGNLLAVSSRGPNNPKSYLLRSPRGGLVSIIDLREKKIIAAFSGGNQPTGLDISNDGKYLCFSNFRDDTIELFWLGD